MRESLRSIARHNMKQMEIQHMNKKRYTAKGEKRQSIFGQHWRELATSTPVMKKERRKKIRSTLFDKRAAVQNKKTRTAEG